MDINKGSVKLWEKTGDLPTQFINVISCQCFLLYQNFGRHNYRKHKLAKVGIKSCRLAGKHVSFVYTWM